MKKTIVSVGLILGLLLANEGVVVANEGIFNLSESNSSNATCLALSVYKDDRYQILGTCRGLLMPFSAEQTRLIVWKGTEADTWSRLAEIEGGKFSGNSNDKFVALKVTAEEDWNPKKPAGNVLAEGKLSELPFEGKQGSNAVIEEFREVIPTPTLTKTTKEVNQDTQNSGGSLIGSVLKAIGTVLLILVIAGVVLTVVTRRKEI